MLKILQDWTTSDYQSSPNFAHLETVIPRVFTIIAPLLEAERLVETISLPWLDKYQKIAEGLKNDLTASLYNAHSASTHLREMKINPLNAVHIENISKMARHTGKTLIQVAEDTSSVHLNTRSMRDMLQEYHSSLDQSLMTDRDKVVSQELFDSIRLARTLTQDVLELATTWTGIYTNTRYLADMRLEGHNAVGTNPSTVSGSRTRSPTRASSSQNFVSENTNREHTANHEVAHRRDEVRRLDALRINIDNYIYQLQRMISLFPHYFKDYRTKVATHLANSSNGALARHSEVVDLQTGSMVSILVSHPSIKRTSFTTFTICIRIHLTGDCDIKHDIRFRCKSVAVKLDLESAGQVALTETTAPAITGADATRWTPHEGSAGNHIKSTNEIEGLISISALQCLTLGMRKRKLIEKEQTHEAALQHGSICYPLTNGRPTCAQWRVIEDKYFKDGLVMVETHLTVDVDPRSGLEIIAHLSIHADFTYKSKAILSSRREISIPATFRRHLNLALLSEATLFTTDTS